LSSIINKDFICHGILKIYTFDKNTQTFTEFEISDLIEYNQTKQYIIHNDGTLSNGTKIPDKVRSEIVNCNKLFVTFTFNPFVEIDNVEENQFLTRNKTFYGVYDFLPVYWIKTEEYPQSYLMNDVPIFIEPSEEDKTEICKLMQQFMDKVKPMATNIAAVSTTDIDEIFNHLIKDESIKKLGQYKMVATFDSSVNKNAPDIVILQKIVKLTPSDLIKLEEKVNAWFSDDIVFKIYVGDKNNPTTMNTIFYSNKYLEQLVETVNDLDRTKTISVNTILKICSTPKFSPSIEFDLINIAFNYMGQKRNEFTPEGTEILQNYEHDHFNYGEKYYDKDNNSNPGPTSSSDAAGDSADPMMIDDPNYLKKGGIRDNYTYIRNSQVTKEQINETTSEEYNALASSLMKTKTGLDKKTQNFCNSYITLMNVFIDFLTLSATELKMGSSKQNSMQHLFYHILSNLHPKIRAQSNIMLGGGKVTYLKPPQDNNKVEYPGNTKDERKNDKKNVIIIGGGPAGLYMGIILKLMAPELEVHILEMRIEKGTNNRIMSRGESTLTVYTKLQNRTKTLPPRFKINVEKYDINNSKINLYTDDFYFLIPTQIKNPDDEEDPDDGINGKKLSVNQLEYVLANYAQQIGVLIFHTTESYDKYVNQNTIGIFDATGGRLKEQKHYQFRVDPDKQDIGDGLNINSLDFYNDTIPIICIGESLFRGNYLTGLGVNTICTMCFFTSFLFTVTMGVKEGYVETYKKFFEKDFPTDTKSNVAASNLGPNPSATIVATSVSNVSANPVSTPVSTPGPNPSANPVSTIVATSVSNVSANPSTTIVSTPGPNPSATPVLTPDPTSDALLKELIDSKDVYIPVLTKDEVIYIEVKFKDNIPENIEIVAMPTTTTVEPSLKTYIEEICNGTKSVSDGTVVYFKFDQTDLDALLGLIT
jgi:hypothetical protein